MKPLKAAACLVAICLIALYPLFLKPHWEFGPDWNIHVQSIGYQSEYLRHHHKFPGTLNTDAIVGMHYPVFYAIAFHPSAAVLALAMGADWAVRLVALLVLITQTHQVRKLA